MKKDATAEQLEDWDRSTVFHPSTDLNAHEKGLLGPPRIMETAQGMELIDRSGKKLLDGFAGLYCVNVGYGRTEIADAIYEQAKQLAYYHTYVGHSNEPLIRLSRRIIDMAPENMRTVFYGLSGSDANETQIKLAWYYQNIVGQPKRRKIISRKRGYHGSGIYTGSLTGLPVFQTHFNLPVDDVLHTVTPHYYWGAEPGMSETDFSRWCADQLESLILAEGPETIAAFIGEPVLGTGGIIPPPEGYWHAIQEVLRKYDILLIADEVVTAFGRLGTNFGSTLYGIEPDLITIAKGLTSAYLPLSGVVVGERVWKVLQQGCEQHGALGHGWTYSGHPVCAAAALANLDIIERENIVDNARVVGAYLQKRLHDDFDDHPIVGEVRGVGLLGALEFVKDPASKTRWDPETKVGPRVAKACLDRALIARAMPHGDILGMAPPLVATESDIDEIVLRVHQAVDAVADELARSGLAS
ncbi:MAG TPA: aminotransferase [Woeseiaceae bacterium]|nr:aminotransferase [Woeseiaceae bacterium]